MRKKGYKGRCEKKDLSKSQEVCRTYDAIQSTYADILQNDNSIQEIRCNVLLDGFSGGSLYLRLCLCQSRWRFDGQGMYF